MGDPASNKIHNLAPDAMAWQYRAYEELQRSLTYTVFFYTLTYKYEPTSPLRAEQTCDKYIQKIKRYLHTVIKPAARATLSDPGPWFDQ